VDKREGKFPKSSLGPLYFIIILTILFTVWHFAALAINRDIVLPNFEATMRQFFRNWMFWEDGRVMSGLLVTLNRVVRGFGIAIALGLPLGIIMGYSRVIRDVLSPFMNSIRQVPVMAWIPLALVWFGMGDGPSLFIIAISSIFPIMLNTIAGVIGIDPNHINAAKSMGASMPKVFITIVLPSALPNFLVGARLGMGLAWMSVICAEFVATNEGFGFLLINSQQGFQFAMLYSLVLMSAVVGFAMDLLMRLIERLLTSWRFKNAAENR